MPFPTFHTADRCSVPCRRDCGNKHSTGSFQHRNAMTCRSRCCMCGIRGHSGKECRQKRCRCGEAHLGQDCGWNPTCRIQGCDRYLCGVHCQDCGSLERPFVGKRCWKCLGFAEPIQHPETKSSRRRNKKLNNQNVDKNSGAQQEEVKTVVTTGLPSEDTTITTESTNPREEREEHQHQQQQQSIFGDPRGPGTNNRNK
ncbi:hypothetical protein QBC44DRAFT_335526 [Cladorrhinum sp. PSN332]|nr:hypothetical protein QBC44DRAFT_335526 [Cladorrhinum sp. PSN332]